MDRGTALNRDSLELSAAFEFETGQGALNPTLLGQSFIIVVDVDGLHRVFLPRVVIGMTGAILILEEHLNVELIFLREVLHDIVLT